MYFETLRLRCDCGRPTCEIREVGFTADHQLVLHWRCSGCKRHVRVLKPLSDCWRDCPSNPELPATFHVEDVEVEDAKFLQSVGIKAGG
jgi:hypothetical protein